MNNMNVTKRNGKLEPLNIEKVHKATLYATDGLNASQSELETASHLMFFDKIKTSDIQKALIVSAAGLISVESPDYTFVASRLLLQTLYKEVTGGEIKYPSLKSYIARGVDEGILDKKLLEFDLSALNAVIEPSRDFNFDYLGLQSVADRYLIRSNTLAGAQSIIELPQLMFMRIAMGLAINENHGEERAIEFYNLLSNFEFLNSTPTLFNSGTVRPQLSSCYGNTVEDAIWEESEVNVMGDGIFATISECAVLSKYAGGIGTDWTKVRGLDDPIVGTNGKSSGVVPYLKIYNDAAVAVNQGGKRNGAFAPYLEVWHPDFMDFIDLKKNSGDERRRAHDIYPASWIPDLFMKRVKANEMWSFISPKEAPELHEAYGEEFEILYTDIEQNRPDLIRDQISAVDLWKKMIVSLFETGHPWITFKDRHNERNPQDHVGTIHNSNLCTEISLNNSVDETFVCNLGSVNLTKVVDGDYDAFFKRVMPIAMRMLDNVIDINFYPSERARRSNMRHRPVGCGMMGYNEFLVNNDVDWESYAHLELADRVSEAFSYYAIEASCDLAIERGSYETFEGSKWSKGVLPIHTAKSYKDITRQSETVFAYNWDALANKVQDYGMRNCNTMAIAPTATISNIARTTPCEPLFELTAQKSNLSGLFTHVSPALTLAVSLGREHLCKSAFNINMEWVIKAGAVRQRWLDQSQSLNLFVGSATTGRELSDLYFLAWSCGLKSTYYLKTRSAEVLQETLSTVSPTEVIIDVETIAAAEATFEDVKMCSIEDPSCQSCQ